MDYHATSYNLILDPQTFVPVISSMVMQAEYIYSHAHPKTNPYLTLASTPTPTPTLPLYNLYPIPI